MRILIYIVITFFILGVPQLQAVQSVGAPQSLKAAKRTDRNINILSARGQETREFEVYVADASFIKLHFKHFKVPPGMLIEISNRNGSESYRYSRDVKGPHTFDTSTGDDGKNSFSAMSISGDTAVIRVLGKPGLAKSISQRVDIDYFLEGLPEKETLPLETNPESRSMLQSLGLVESLQTKQKDINPEPESNCGADERYDAVCWEGSNPEEFDRSRPVAMILVGYKTCTAWRVGPDNRLFTNNHCIANQAEANATEVWFNFQSMVCGSSEMGDVVKVSADQLLSTNETLDYSLFTVNDFNSIQSFGNLGLDVREGVLGEEIYIPQHGGGSPKQMAIESDMNVGGLCQVDDTDFDGRDTGSDIGYFCDTIGGSSGSPVISSDSNKVIALHHFGGCLNSGAKMTLIWKKVGRHFGRVVPEGDGGSTPPEPEPNTDPVARFSYACNQLSCSFNGDTSSDSDGSIVAYNWNFGDSGSGSGVTSSHVFSSEGTYAVTLTVQDDSGAYNATTKTLSVVTGTTPPPSQINLSGTTTKNKGSKLVHLNWSGTESSVIHIYRNDALLLITENDGAYTDSDLGKRDKSATYKVCEQAQTNCSNELRIDF